MTEHSEEQGEQEEIEVPDGAVEDLEPSDDESEDVGGGSFKQGWISK